MAGSDLRRAALPGSAARKGSAQVVSQIAERGLKPAECETYTNGVRKATFRDPDGNEIGFGGAPV